VDEQPIPTASAVVWPLRRVGRWFLSAVAGVAVAMTTTALPRETRIIIGLDTFLATLVALMLAMMSVGTAAQCALMARERERIRHTELMAALVATLVGIAAIAVMLHSQRDEARWLRTVHLGGSLLALLLGWIAVQVTFAIQYMRAYYRNQEGAGSHRTEPGLEFPGQRSPDLWDFAYYSFTIGMCFQTSDVSISGSAIRRLSLVHAIYSFFYVAAIIGFTVNVLSNLA
jgi:uncharacterized membrane protein